MAQERFHVGVEYRLCGKGETNPRADMVLHSVYKHRTVPKFRADRVLVFDWKRGEQERFRRGVVYEIASPGQIRTKVKYIDRFYVGAECFLVFRRLRVRKGALV